MRLLYVKNTRSERVILVTLCVLLADYAFSCTSGFGCSDTSDWHLFCGGVRFAAAQPPPKEDAVRSPLAKDGIISAAPIAAAIPAKAPSKTRSETQKTTSVQAPKAAAVRRPRATVLSIPKAAPEPTSIATVLPTPKVASLPKTKVTTAPLPVGKPPMALTDAVAKSFIRVSGNVFVDDSCREYLYTGWNGFNELLTAGLKVPAPKTLAAAPALLAAQADFATRQYAEAVNAKLSVTRVFAAGGDYQNIQLQTQPGVYNETVFRGIDYILAQASRFNIKVVLSIINNWDIIDGKGQFVAWAKVKPDMFWTDPRVRTIYKNHLKALTDRVNVFTGVAYKTDPTIFSWNLYNEPRNPANQTGPGKPAPVTAWVNEMSAVLAALDPNHMITVGEEGFFVKGSRYEKYNPFGVPGNVTPGWAGRIGQDFIAQHSSPNIAYAAFHFWPDNWNTVEPRFVPLWMEGHILAAQQLKKPLVLEEFGKVAATDKSGLKILNGPAALLNITLTRDPVYRKIYDYVEKGMSTNGPLRAALFWDWSLDKRTTARSVLSTDSTFDIVKAHGAFLAHQPRPIQANCVPRPPVTAQRGP